MGEKHQRTGSERGFAAMDEAKQRAIARKGGESVPPEKRSFSQNHDLAATAGRKGGQSVAAEDRSFSRNRELAAEAGRKGGQESSGGRGGQKLRNQQNTDGS
jgi:general stress protein YciG